MRVIKTILNPFRRLDNPQGEKGSHFSDQLLEKARFYTDTVLTELKSQLSNPNMEETGFLRSKGLMNATRL